MSNVLNGRTSVKPELVARVHAAMRDLDYVPNSHARQLSSGSSRTLGLLVLSGYDSFFNTLAEVAEDAAEKAGFSVLLGGSSQRAERETRYLDLFEEQRVGGIMLAPIGGVTPRVRSIHASGTPIVLLGVADADGDFSTVQSDAEHGGYVAVRHLIEQGRRDILVAGGPIHQVRGRVDGAARAVAETPGVRMDYLSTVTLSIDEGRRVGARVLATPPERRPDAIFAANDRLAIGLMHEITREGGIRIPDDLSLIGHDDIEFAATAQVPLTTVRQPVELIAQAAVELTVAEIAAGPGHEHSRRVYSPELVVRHTSLPTSVGLHR
ncbi:LacI family DNA-binding transcriptional regulator [Agromyces marinus]|uniref:LacI family DNA-binding transcriptional regulator n=1 Tax=Agromyces marinus TaxID=1389020 RepID=UPI001F1772EE|nr:LacI family DNA-binding transcriptional regulator [Agromyces marinus]